jgi:hypothetical protein
MQVVDLHAEALSLSLKTLRDRIRLLKRFLHTTAEGQIEPDYSLLRMSKSLCGQLPALPHTNVYTSELSDAMIVAYIATIQTGSHALNELLEKIAVIGREHGKF